MRSSLLGLSAVTSLALACSAPLASPGSAGDAFLHDAAEGSSSAALVAFSRTASADDSSHGSAVARFIRMRSGLVDDQTLRMVGATLDLPTLGTCAPAAVAGDSLALDLTQDTDGPRAVELLDVGALAVEASGAHATLEARALPDIVDLVTGVLYSTRAAFDADGLPAQGTYLLRSTGSVAAVEGEHGVPAFTVSASAPGEPQELRIDGQDARAAEGVTLAAGGRVELGWARNEGGDADDVVYVDLTSTSEGRTGESASVRCAFADRGTASLPASAFVVGATASSAGVEMTRGTVIVHRVHSEAFHVAGVGEQAGGRAGIEAGVVRFDFARSAEFTRR